MCAFPAERPRRLRRTPALRRLVTETQLHPGELVLPMFVKEAREGTGGGAKDGARDGTRAAPQPVPSMLGVVQHTRDSLRKEAREAVEAGVGGLMLFGVPRHKDARGSAATDPEGVLQVAIRDVVSEVGDAAVVIPDLCLDEFTDHGHCGVLTPEGAVDNDATLQRYAEMARAQAEAGAHMLGLSGMMDGQVGAVRTALDAAGHTSVAVLAYAAKSASAFYGPFRDAVDSSLAGDRTTYQMDPANGLDALREVRLDVAEGADVVMVKPALPQLDLVRRVADAVDVPVAAYQVSGEYAMVEAAAQRGLLDRDRVILETLTGLRRAGARVLATYWATEAARRLR